MNQSDERMMEINIEVLKEATIQSKGRIISMGDLEKDMALSLVSEDACKKGDYTPAGPNSPVAPGVHEDSKDVYSVHVYNPAKVGGNDNA